MMSRKLRILSETRTSILPRKWWGLGEVLARPRFVLGRPGLVLELSAGRVTAMGGEINVYRLLARRPSSCALR